MTGVVTFTGPEAAVRPASFRTRRPAGTETITTTTTISVVPALWRPEASGHLDLGRGVKRVMAEGYQEGKKSSPWPQRSEQGEGKVGTKSSQPRAACFKAQGATGVARGQPWRRETRKASCWVCLEDGRMTDEPSAPIYFTTLFQGQITSLRFYFICQVGIDVSFPLAVPWKSRSQ